MTRKSSKKRMTLSEHLALRAQESAKKAAQEEARMQTRRALMELDSQALCTCPACVRLRQLNKR